MSRDDTRRPDAQPEVEKTPEVRGLAHVAIAVREADPVVELLVSALGATRGEEEMLYGGDLRVVFVHLGTVTFELLEPRSKSNTVAQFLEKRGPGLHHVALSVENIEEALARCKQAGVALIDETPREGAHGARIAFLHPRSVAGVLVELCERGEG